MTTAGPWPPTRKKRSVPLVAMSRALKSVGKGFTAARADAAMSQVLSAIEAIFNIESIPQVRPEAQSDQRVRYFGESVTAKPAYSAAALTSPLSHPSRSANALR